MKNRHHGNTLSAAGFTDNAQKLSCVNVQVNTPHGLDDPASGSEIGLEIFYFQKVFTHIENLLPTFSDGNQAHPVNRRR